MNLGSTRYAYALPSFHLLLAALTGVLTASCSSEGGGPTDTGPVVSSVTVTVEQDTLVAIGATTRLEVTALDANGGPLPSPEIDWTSDRPGTVEISAEGIATALDNGSARISAAVGGVSGSATVTVAQAVESVTVTPTALTFGTAGDTTRLEASATDPGGTPISDPRILWLSSDPTVASVDTAGLVTARGSGEATVTAAVRGVPSHTSVTVDQQVFSLAFRVDPPDVVAGEIMSTAVQVEARDSGGTVVPDADLPVTLSVAEPVGADLTGTTTVQTVNGVATFSGLSMETAGAAHTLMASATGANAALSSIFAVSPAAPTSLGFTIVADTVTAGQALGTAVSVFDEFGNVATQATLDITLSLVTDPYGGIDLLGTTTVTTSEGVATFSEVTIERAASGYEVGASTTELPDTRSEAFTIVPDAPDRLVLGRIFPAANVPGYRVFVEDQFSNRTPAYTEPVTVTLLSVAYPPASLSGTATVTPAEGVADFADLRLDRPGPYTTEITASGIPTRTDTSTVQLQTDVQRPRPIAAGGQHTCLAAAGGVFCAGAADALGASPLGALDSVPLLASSSLVSVEAGPAHTCGLDASGAAWCWGDNTDGQVGNGATGGQVASPASVLGGITFSTVTAGTTHSCGLTGSGQAYCWGDNTYGQLGDGNTGTGSPSPAPVGGSHVFVAISAGEHHTCGLDDGDLVWCWGRNDQGQLGNNDLGVDRGLPVATAGGEFFGAVSAGARHTCALTDVDGPAQYSSVYCWGDNADGQLGTGNLGTDEPAPVNINLLDQSSSGVFFAAVDVSAGERHTCAARSPFSEGPLVCWGDNTYGQLGRGTAGGVVDQAALATVTLPPELDVLTVENWTDLSSGVDHTCGVLRTNFTGIPLCWGRNDVGQLAVADLQDRSSPALTVW